MSEDQTRYGKAKPAEKLVTSARMQEMADSLRMAAMIAELFTEGKATREQYVAAQFEVAALVPDLMNGYVAALRMLLDGKEIVEGAVEIAEQANTVSQGLHPARRN